MYAMRGQFGAAKAGYQRVDVSSRVEGADPHQLVTILYDELIKSLEAMAVAVAKTTICSAASGRHGRCG
jgi:flagellar protein FliS